ncbi:MAG: FprA family A-type flavoprotein [Anaerolineae bacterium]
MPAIEIKPGIHWIGVNDRLTDLFEGLWPIREEGISYNSYLVTDEKNVLVDLTKATQEGAFLDQIGNVIDPARLDYIVLNHMEPDHTGAIRILRQVAPHAEYLCTARAKALLDALFGFSEHVHVVEDGEELAIGQKRLRFLSIPFVHWPETMATYEVTQKVLFPCDGFGGYGALRGAIFDDQYDDMDDYLREALRYFANIIALYSGPVLRAIEKLQSLEIDVVAPSHGLVWRKEPQRIIALYKHWAEYVGKPGDRGVTLIYGSMYGNTEEMMNAVAQGISDVGVPVRIFDAARTHASYILPSLMTRRGVMIGAPTYEGSLFPPVEEALRIAQHKRLGNKTAAIFGSYGWGGGAEREFRKLAEQLKWDVADAFVFNGAPTYEDLRKGEAFGQRFGELISSD